MHHSIAAGDSVYRSSSAQKKASILNSGDLSSKCGISLAAEPTRVSDDCRSIKVCMDFSQLCSIFLFIQRFHFVLESGYICKLVRIYSKYDNIAMKNHGP